MRQIAWHYLSQGTDEYTPGNKEAQLIRCPEYFYIYQLFVRGVFGRPCGSIYEADVTEHEQWLLACLTRRFVPDWSRELCRHWEKVRQEPTWPISCGAAISKVLHDYRVLATANNYPDNYIVIKPFFLNPDWAIANNFMFPRNQKLHWYYPENKEEVFPPDKRGLTLWQQRKFTRQTARKKVLHPSQMKRTKMAEHEPRPPHAPSLERFSSKRPLSTPYPYNTTSAAAAIILEQEDRSDSFEQGTWRIHNNGGEASTPTRCGQEQKRQKLDHTPVIHQLGQIQDVEKQELIPQPPSNSIFSKAMSLFAKGVQQLSGIGWKTAPSSSTLQ